MQHKKRVRMIQCLYVPRTQKRPYLISCYTRNALWSLSLNTMLSLFVQILLIFVIMADSTAEVTEAATRRQQKLPPLEETRTILAHTSQAVLSTFSKRNEGYPSGSIVKFACDAYGSPIIALNSSAAHTKDLQANPKCSLLVAKDAEDTKDLVIRLCGDAVAVVSKEEREAIRTAYLSMHPNALWVDSDGIEFMRIEPKVVEYEYGVGTSMYDSGEFSGEEYKAAEVDPIYQFSKPISNHMNKDHTDDTKLIVQHSTSLLVTSAYMVDVDSLGFNVKADVAGDTLKLRVPFPRRAMNRKDVRVLMVEMLQAAKASLAGAADKDL